MRLWEERDPFTHQLIAIREAISTYEQERTTWIGPKRNWFGFVSDPYAERDILTAACRPARLSYPLQPATL
jgi:hypothetical protein